MEEQGIPFEIVDYHRDPPTREQLRVLAESIDGEPGELLRRDAKHTESQLSPTEMADVDRILDILSEHPEWLQRPIAVYGQRAIIGRPPERILDLFSDD